ncbi:DNA-sulfur modification-associated [Maridesulfovibrio ferrireducens]|uniref:DNA-sulfur modification-associated n=1 Tax=Maridesulfovibrio ferrireducens TaxID=246191 RepID=A0A1G9EQS6_9BACT|nr:DNA sulfur modification protein DndB [Maridesulfovibrio ferrireducens]SDK78444.1 DNA-sulfur modification-associated [Maridesulfovibrio ferrireducens]
MANKTFIPAFKAKVGDWNYYICQMKYAEVARQVNFAHELNGNSELNKLLQRGLTSRTADIKDYLLKSDHRFLGSLIIAAWGGDPQYMAVQIEDRENALEGLDRNFGILTFDGTQNYFALDGQHRLKAIKDAVMLNPELGREDICVLLVSHMESTEGRVRTRRLFTNINRNAKITSKSENIVLDEDDGIAIITRRFLEEHPFFKESQRVKVITKSGSDGELKIAPPGVSPSDKFSFTSIMTLYKCLKSLAFDLPVTVKNDSQRPSPEVLENAYSKLSIKIDDLMKNCGDVANLFMNVSSAKELRAPKDKEYEGHAFTRPVVQNAVCEVLAHAVGGGDISWEDAMQKLNLLEWRIGQAPWISVFAPPKKMLSGKDNSNLLFKILLAHIAPRSKQSIKDARKEFQEVRGQQYPIAYDDLVKDNFDN